MNRKEGVKTIFLYGVFICYIIFLGKLLFLSRISFLELFDGQRVLNRSINLIPFYSIREYLFSDSVTIRSFAFSNVAGNIIAFIPLGAYLTLFKKDKRITTNLFIIFIVSLAVETIQGLFAIGAADIDDIILNCLGGLLGILGYKLLLLIFQKEKNVRTVAVILSAVGLPVLLYLLFMIKLRL